MPDVDMDIERLYCTNYSTTERQPLSTLNTKHWHNKEIWHISE